MKHSILFLGILFLSLQGAAKEYEVDASHSHFGFQVKHMGVSYVRGNFSEFEGVFDYTDGKPETAKGMFKVKAKSISTNEEKRDNHLRSEDFFYVEKFPELTFNAKRLKKDGKMKYKLEGDLTMRGVTKPTVFDVEYLGATKDPWGNSRVGFTAKSKVNRKDFGIIWNKILDNGGLVVADQVEILLDVEAIEKKTASAKTAAISNVQ